jgi:hypothetical protein
MRGAAGGRVDGLRRDRRRLSGPDGQRGERALVERTRSVPGPSEPLGIRRSRN